MPDKTSNNTSRTYTPTNSTIASKSKNANKNPSPSPPKRKTSPRAKSSSPARKSTSHTGVRRLSPSHKAGGTARKDNNFNVAVSEERKRAWNKCVNEHAKENRKEYRVSKVKYSYPMTPAQTKKASVFVSEHLNINESNVEDLFKYDTMKRLSDELLCRWPRPSELTKIARILSDGDSSYLNSLDFFTGILHVEAKSEGEFGKIVGKLGRNFNSLTDEFDLMYIWLTDTNEVDETKSFPIKKEVLLYGLDADNVIHAVIELANGMNKNKIRPSRGTLVKRLMDKTYGGMGRDDIGKDDDIQEIIPFTFNDNPVYSQSEYVNPLFDDENDEEYDNYSFNVTSTSTTSHPLVALVDEYVTDNNIEEMPIYDLVDPSNSLLNEAGSKAQRGKKWEKSKIGKGKYSSPAKGKKVKRYSVKGRKGDRKLYNNNNVNDYADNASRSGNNDN